MKKVICSAAVVALMSLVMASCNKQAPKVDEKPASTSAASTDMKIAFIEVDSIMSQYKFCNEHSAILEKIAFATSMICLPMFASLMVQTYRSSPPKASIT